jgi:hypothetical protein
LTGKKVGQIEVADQSESGSIQTAVDFVLDRNEAHA